MAWFKVDDKLWGHPKWLMAPPRARGLWVSAGSWSASNETDGLIPGHALAALGGTRADAKALVKACLWTADGDNFRFHGWTDFQPDAASLRAKRDAESEAGARGNHNRWHARRGVRVPGCEFCDALPPDTLPDRVPDWVPDEVPDRVSVGSGRVGADSSRPVPVPDRDSPDLGGEPKQRASERPQPCGRAHNPATACGACADARRGAKDDELEAQRAKSQRERDATRAAQEARAREAAATIAEADADPDQTERAKAAAFAAVRSEK